jgi:tripartite-type tricarboxylate transporter receptor subunit TctC
MQYHAVMKRRSLMSFGALGALVAPTVIPGLARAQSVLPNRSIRIFVGFEPGGGADLTARAVATQVERRLSRHVSVENRTGASGAVPGELMKKGTPDGSQLALLSSTTLVAKLTSKDFPFDPLRDVAPVMQVGDFPIAFAVSKTLGVSTFDEYLKWLKEGDASRRRIAVASNLAFLQVLNVILAKATGETLEPVSYRGPIAAVADVEQGRIPASVNTVTSLLPAHRGGRVRILMTTGAKRLAVAGDIPTASELGYPKLDMREWFAFFAPPATPPAVIAEWNRRLALAVGDAAVGDVLRPLGLEIETSTAEELAARVASHQTEWETRMRTAGMEPVL